MNTLNLNPITQTVRPNFVSENYGFVQTQPLIELVSSYGWQVDKITLPKVRKASREGFQKHQIAFRPNNWGMLLERDGEYPRILLTNSHDRTSALSFNFGWYRFACDNGLMVGSAFLSAFKVYHSGQHLEVKAREAIEAALTRFPEVEQCRQLMRSTLLNADDIAELTINVNKAVSEIRDFSIQTPLYNIQRKADTSRDLWTVFNVLQEQSLGAQTGTKTEIDVTSGEIRSRQLRARKVKSLALDQKINKAVFDEAYKMLQKVG